jgi:hypothetical protein
MSIQDDLRQAVGERQGSAIRFTDIDGIGQKTAQSIKQSGRIRSPSDVSDKTADELAEQADISESRARKAIKGAGGDPDRTPRSNTGSVSAAGIRVPTGEFKTEISDKDTAAARFQSSLNRGIGRSQNAAIADKGKRAPVTTDVERWKENKGELDFPGVDTPTDDPKVLPKDLRQKQRPATTDPPERPTPRRDDTGSAAGALSSSLGVSTGERRGSMVADGMGGVQYNANVGGYRETDRADEEIAPPDDALAEQGEFLSIESNERAAEAAGVLQPEPDGSAVGDLAAGKVPFRGD